MSDPETSAPIPGNARPPPPVTLGFPRTTPLPTMSITASLAAGTVRARSVRPTPRPCRYAGRSRASRRDHGRASRHAQLDRERPSTAVGADDQHPLAGLHVDRLHAQQRGHAGERRSTGLGHAQRRRLLPDAHERRRGRSAPPTRRPSHRWPRSAPPSRTLLLTQATPSPSAVTPREVAPEHHRERVLGVLLHRRRR